MKEAQVTCKGVMRKLNERRVWSEIDHREREQRELRAIESKSRRGREYESERVREKERERE